MLFWSSAISEPKQRKNNVKSDFQIGRVNKTLRAIKCRSKNVVVSDADCRFMANPVNYFTLVNGDVT